jgi:hypothetical protein
VAGVQLESRQHSSLEPFFQGRPSTLRHWSDPLAAFSSSAEGACAMPTIGMPRAADANSIATLFNFFMILLSRKAKVAWE